MNRIGILGAAVTLFAAALRPMSLDAADNELTDEEAKAGWVLLFDGKSTRGWMSPKRRPLPASHVQDGALNPHPCDYMLVHERVWDDFRLALDFKISRKCNSGVFIRTLPLEPRPGKDVGFNGIEVAIDDTTTAGFHDTGAIYDLSKPATNAMKPAGEWNHAVITCDRNVIEVELNGERVNRVDLDQWTRENRRPDGSEHKFDVVYKHHPRRGYIGLQDHGADCWFRNIKLLPLGAAPTKQPGGTGPPQDATCPRRCRRAAGAPRGLRDGASRCSRWRRAIVRCRRAAGAPGGAGRPQGMPGFLL